MSINNVEIINNFVLTNVCNRHIIVVEQQNRTTHKRGGRKREAERLYHINHCIVCHSRGSNHIAPFSSRVVITLTIIGTANLARHKSFRYIM